MLWFCRNLIITTAYQKWWALYVRENSRIKMLMSGQKASTEIMLMSAIVDRLSLLVWQNTEDARKK